MLNRHSNKGFKIGRKLSLEEREEAVALYLEGYSVLKIAEKYGIHHTTVVYYTRNVRHLRKELKPHNTEIGQIIEEEIIPEPPKMSKELKEEMKINPSIGRKNYITKLTSKGLTYKDYLRIDREKELKKLCKKHL